MCLSCGEQELLGRCLTVARRLLPSMGAYPSADTQDLSPIEAETSA